MPVRRDLMLAVLAGVVIAAGVVAWMIYLPALGPEAGQDWMVFHAVANAWLHGDSALAFHGNRLTALINIRHAAWLSRPLTLRPWLYPPSFLLLLLPFGTLPFLLSWGLFQALTAALLALALWHSGPRGGARALLIAAVALCPAIPVNLILGQNAFLTSALLVGGFALLP
ncbi:MAG: glycosyltransferase 87 family protein, partial [Acetobacteraceae bacterium]